MGPHGADPAFVSKRGGNDDKKSATTAALHPLLTDANHHCRPTLAATITFTFA